MPDRVDPSIEARADEWASRIVDRLADWVCLVALDGNIIRSNRDVDPDPRFVDTCAWLDMWTALDRPRAQTAFEAALANGEGRFEGVLDCGDETPWEVDVSAIRDSEGQPEAILCVGRPAGAVRGAGLQSDRADLSEAVAHELRIVDALVASIADFVYTFDRDGRFVYVNKPLLDLWGLRLDEAIGKNFFDLRYPDDLATKLSAQIQRVFDTKTPVVDRTLYTSPTGAGGYYEYIFQPIVGPDGSVELVAGSTRDITASQHEVDILQRNEENFRTLAESLPDAVWTADPFGQIVWTNEKLLRATGKPAEELVGHGYWDLIHPDDIPATAEAWNRVRTLGSPIELQHRVLQADGSWRWNLVRATPARDTTGEIYRWIGTSTDIHGQRELQSRLEQSEARFRQLADAMPQIVWTATPNGVLDYYNRRWFAYIDCPPDDLATARWDRYVHPDDLESTSETWARALRTGDPYTAEFRVRRADGVYRWFLVRARAVRDETGRIERWFGTCTDIQDQKELQAEKELLLESERAARGIAENASRMKDEFLATLSHELRTPLNAILGWTQILRRQHTKNDELLRGLDTIERNARVQTRLIEDLLDMSRIISGKLRMDVQALQPAAFVEAAIETVTPAAAAKGIRIDASLDPHAGPVWGDGNRLQQVVWNLLSNAIKFTPTDGRVDVTLQRVGTGLDIRITDTGEGIAEEFLPHVFDRFRQADASASRRYSGLGLGLAIVKQLVELHGGTVSATSAGDARGSTFTVHLPLRIGREDSAGGDALRVMGMAAQRPGSPEVGLAGLRVLVVDDDLDGRAFLRRLLSDAGAEVSEASSASEGLEWIRIERPDVIVSDIGMPGVDGYEFLRQVRALLPTGEPHVPAVALTAFARIEDRTLALAAGYSAHVSKPADPDELIATIASVVEPRL